MFFLQNTKNINFSNFSFSFGIKWIDIDNFLIFSKRIVFLFRIQRKKFNFQNKFKMKKIFCHAKILNAEMSFKKKKIMISNSDGVLQFKTKNFFNDFQFFFFNFTIDFFKEDFFQSSLIYGIGRLKLKNQEHNNLKKNYTLVIINLQEGVFLNVYKFKNYWFNENLFCFAPKQKTIFIAHENQLFFFFFDFTNKKIYKSSICHDFEIDFLKFCGQVLLFGDKNGQIFFIENHNTKNFFKKKNQDCWKDKFFFKKKKITSFENSIRIGIFYRKKIIGFLFSHSPKFIIFNLASKKKKKLMLTKTDEILQIKNFDGKKELLIVSADFHLFFFYKKKRWKFMNYPNLNFLNLIPTNFLLEKKKFAQIFIFPLIFFSKKIFFLFSPENFFEILNIKKNRFKKFPLNFFEFFKKKKFLENPKKILRDYTGKKIFLFTDFFVFQIYIKNFFHQKDIKIETKNFINYVPNNKKFTKKVKSCIDQKGKKIAIICPKGEMQIWNTSCFPSSTRNFKKILNLTKKETNLIEFSSDGNFLGIIVGKILIIWKIFPKFIKFKSTNLCFEEEIVALKNFSNKGKQNFLIYSKNEFSIFNINENIIINKMNIKIVQITTEFWDGKFAGIIRFFYPKNLEKKQSIVIFKGFSLVPIFLLESKNIFTKNVISLNFSYSKKKKKFRCLVIDSLLKFHKIYF